MAQQDALERARRDSPGAGGQDDERGGRGGVSTRKARRLECSRGAHSPLAIVNEAERKVARGAFAAPVVSRVPEGLSAGGLLLFERFAW